MKTLWKMQIDLFIYLTLMLMVYLTGSRSWKSLEEPWSGGEERPTEVIAGVSHDYSIKALHPRVRPPTVSYYLVPAFVFVSAGISSRAAMGLPGSAGPMGPPLDPYAGSPSSHGIKSPGPPDLVTCISFDNRWALHAPCTVPPRCLVHQSSFWCDSPSFLYAGFILHSLFIIPYICPRSNSLC